MPHQASDRLREIKTFPSLVKYLRDHLDWPIDTDDFEDLTFDYRPEELGIDAKTAAKIDEIKQLRPLSANQPWGIFFIKFEPKRLPVAALRRVLSGLVIKKRATARASEQAAWNLHDLLFVSNYGEGDERQITFAHFSEDVPSGGLPTLKVLGWDDADTVLHLDHVHRELETKLRWPKDESDEDAWREQWSSAFTLRHREVIRTSKELALRLADLARRIRIRAGNVLAIETERGALRKLHKAFQEALIHDLNEDDFADMYAQTVTYGLFSAAVSRPAGVIADNLVDMVPVTNPFLKEMLSTFLTAGGRRGRIDFDELGIQEVTDLLNSPDTHMDAILRDFGNRRQEEDPVVHFYELFLAQYDKKKKVQRGVFFTPRPVVSYIVRSVHEILQTEFGLEEGLASTVTWGEMVERNPDIKIPMLTDNPDDGRTIDPNEPFVQILDPATGTGTFLVEVIDLIHRTMTAKWAKEGLEPTQRGEAWNEYVPKHLLPRLYGYELMMAPYTIAHMKLGLKLYETGYRFESDERVRIYLTNALEPGQAQLKLPEVAFLAHEAREVNHIKRNGHFSVVLGNPPYSYESANTGDWITSLVADYYSVDGHPLGERNPRGLQDDYVKFIRFAQWRIEKTGYGILGFVTNHGYLDSPTFRGMRQQLMNAFNDIYVLDLHGNKKKKEVAPDGGPDKNVFDIQQGVGIGVFLKEEESEETTSVKHRDLWGLREEKIAFLGESDISTAMEDITPNDPFYLFVPQDQELRDEYTEGWSVSDVMPVNAVGIVTARDEFAIRHSSQELLRIVADFAVLSPETARDKYRLGKDTRDWKVSLAQADIRRHGTDVSRAARVLYRPLDWRYTYYSGQTRGFLSYPRHEAMGHMLSGTNVALITSRMTKGEMFAHAQATRDVSEKIVMSPNTSNNGFHFPLYLYPAHDEQSLLDAEVWPLSEGRRPNLSPEFVSDLKARLGMEFVTDGNGDLEQTFGPEDIFAYIYAVFHSPTYRTRYADFLKRDFPRVPLTSDPDLFRALVGKGAELVSLHLMESPKLEAHITEYVGSPEPTVEKVSYSDETVWMDKARTNGFRGVPEDVWQFHIGGYQVCEKWLKDRKGRVLSAEDVEHYHRIVVALHETIRIMREIDEVIEAHGGWPLVGSVAEETRE